MIGICNMGGCLRKTKRLLAGKVNRRPCGHVFEPPGQGASCRGFRKSLDKSRHGGDKDCLPPSISCCRGVLDRRPNPPAHLLCAEQSSWAGLQVLSLPRWPRGLDRSTELPLLSEAFLDLLKWNHLL